MELYFYLLVLKLMTLRFYKAFSIHNRKLYFKRLRDLYVLLSWEEEESTEIKVNMEDGFYEVIVFSWLPESGIRGKNQQIDFYFNRTTVLPQLHYEGVPSLL